MRILITTGIYPPESGGPATYVQNLAKVLVKQGHQAMVITYSDKSHYTGDSALDYKLIRVKRTNKVLNYINFFKVVNKSIKNFDIIYCFDHFSAGIPSVLVSKLSKKKIVIRVGGDFIWERYLRITKKGITLKDYYNQNLYKKDWLRFLIIKLVFKFTDLIIFTTKFQKEIFQEPYKLVEANIKYIHNPFSSSQKIYSRERNKEILWSSGRMIEKNNIRRLIKVFSSIKQNEFKLVLIGGGEIKKELEELVQNKDFKNIFFKKRFPREKVLDEMQKSYAMVFPSYTDISPNTLLECISTGTPFIVTIEQGFDWLKGKVLEFNPLSNEEMKESLEKIMDLDFYNSYQKKIMDLDYNYTYEEASKDTIKLFKEVI